MGMILIKADYRAALKEIKVICLPKQALVTRFLLASDKMDSETPA